MNKIAISVYPIADMQVVSNGRMLQKRAPDQQHPLGVTDFEMLPHEAELIGHIDAVAVSIPGPSGVRQISRIVGPEVRTIAMDFPERLSPDGNSTFGGLRLCKDVVLEWVDGLPRFRPSTFGTSEGKPIQIPAIVAADPSLQKSLDDALLRLASEALKVAKSARKAPAASAAAASKKPKGKKDEVFD